MVDSESRRPQRSPVSGWMVWIILVLALLVRLVDYDAPLTGENSWRQADTAAMARNFHVEARPLHEPAIDARGDRSGLVETEFPIFPWLVAGLYQIFGVNDAIGRVLSAFFSVIGLWALYRLVAELMDYRTGVWAMIVSAFAATSIYYGRSFQPESMMLMSSLVGLFLCARYMRTGGQVDLVVSALFVSLAVLNKITALFIGLPILYLFWLRWGSRLFMRFEIYLYGFLVLAPVVGWYAHAHSLYLESGLSFGIWGYGVGKWGNWDMILSFAYWKRLLYSYLIVRHLHFVGFILFLIGIFLKRRTPQERFFDFWIIGGGVFLLVVGRGNFHHEYYQLPVLLPVSVFIAKVLSRFLKWPLWSGNQESGSMRSMQSVAVAVCILAMGGLSAERYVAYLGRAAEKTRIQVPMADKVALHVPPRSLVLSFTGGDPTLLYLADRKGWLIRSRDLDPKRLAAFRDRGAVAIFGAYEALENADQRGVVKALRDEVDIVVLHDDDRNFLYGFTEAEPSLSSP